jgi:putative two-component system response regulator
MRKKILAVDDEPTNLRMLGQILRERYELIFATSGAAAIEIATENRPDLILLDIMMPGMNGYEVCAKLKANPTTQEIPVIFVTAMGDVEDEAQGFDVGAVDYIQKPVSAPILLRRVQTHLSLVQMHELEKSHRDMVFMLGEAGHYNDNDTGAHIWRIAAYASALATAAGWPAHLVQRLELAAPLHDTGKIGIPDTLLQAPRKLTAEEWKTMQRHPEIGYSILSKSQSPLFTMAAEIARSHHEKWDGTGYPSGLKGEEIPEAARIIALADVFDALTTKRPYKEAWSVADALAEIRKGAGSHFEPRLVPLFEQIVPELERIKNESGAQKQAVLF